MRKLYAALLNDYPLVIPAGIFLVAFFLLLPFTGPYAAVIAVAVAGALTAVW